MIYLPKSTNQRLKLLYLKRIFEECTDDDHGLTMPQIISKLNEYDIQAERKSLYADMELLRLYGVDVEKRKSKTVEYYVANREFELPELKLLVDAVQSSKFITHKKSNLLIKKVGSLASAHQAKQLQRQVYVTNRTKNMNENIYYNVDEIQNAIHENRQISFQYFEWEIVFGSSEKVVKKLKRDGDLYTVSPWALTWDDENYYLIAFESSSGIIKHYRVDKMMSISRLQEKREGESIFEEFDIGNYSKMTFGMYGGKTETVHIEFKNRLIGVVVDRFGKDIPLVKKDDERFVATVKVMISPQFFAWVFGLGEDVKIIKPEDVVAQFKSYLKEISDQYF